jgi:hypothetical protein
MSTYEVQEKVFAKKLHQSLNAHGVKVRESRDSDNHPESNAICVFFDVTGSMGGIPAHFASHKLGHLVGMLTADDMVAGPQVLFGAIGDAYNDRAPFQVGQFEAGIEMDDCLTRVFIEQGGGGDTMESYGLAHYFASRHTAIDCFEKRQKKGYLFTLGDERAHEQITRAEASSIFGDKLQVDVSLHEAIKAAKERYNVFHIVVGGGSSHGDDPATMKFWRELLGQNVLKLDEPDNVCEMIAATIGVIEGRAIDAVESVLVGGGSSKKAADAVTRAIGPLFNSLNA